MGKTTCIVAQIKEVCSIVLTVLVLFAATYMHKKISLSLKNVLDKTVKIINIY